MRQGKKALGFCPATNTSYVILDKSLNISELAHLELEGVGLSGLGGLKYDP